MRSTKTNSAFIVRAVSAPDLTLESSESLMSYQINEMKESETEVGSINENGHVKLISGPTSSNIYHNGNVKSCNGSTNGSIDILLSTGNSDSRMFQSSSPQKMDNYYDQRNINGQESRDSTSPSKKYASIFKPKEEGHLEL